MLYNFLAKSLFILITLSDTNVSNEHCILCKYQIIQTHNTEIARLLNQPRPSIVANFNSTPICETPLGEQLNLDDLKTIYAKNYPVWNKKFQCFPEGPNFYDKLFTSQPYTTAKDIENKKNELKAQIGQIANIVSVDKLEIVQIADIVIASLEEVLNKLKLTEKNSERVKRTLIGMLKSKSKEMKDMSQSEIMELLNDVQNQIFHKILEYDRIFSLYEMR